MSNDGASLGVNAQKGLEAVLGRKQPKKEDKMTREQMKEYLMSAPEKYEEGQKSYEEAGRWLARQFLILLGEGYEDDTRKLYDEVERRQGGKDMGFTGFMVGWAANAVRYVNNKPEESNPAIISIGRR